MCTPNSIKKYIEHHKAMQIQRIINGDLPGPNKHMKCNNILRLDDDLFLLIAMHMFY